jgi:hypothetical protein
MEQMQHRLVEVDPMHSDVDEVDTDDAGDLGTSFSCSDPDGTGSGQYDCRCVLNFVHQPLIFKAFIA